MSVVFNIYYISLFKPTPPPPHCNLFLITPALVFDGLKNAYYHLSHLGTSMQITFLFSSCQLLKCYGMFNSFFYIFRYHTFLSTKSNRLFLSVACYNVHRSNREIAQ